MRYRLAVDLGSTSLGWAMIRLNQDDNPCAVIKAGVRIFSDGRNPKDGSSLAVTRRAARAMRRRRDRLLKRKARMMRLLIQHGFFADDPAQRKALEQLDPYRLRAEGLDRLLKPGEFARALFHLNQRRGFKSNRKTDKKENDSGALKQAIRQLHQSLQQDGCRTVGQWLHRRHGQGQSVRARYHERKVMRDDGKSRLDKYYDLYIDRAMVEAEFDALWATQSTFDPVQYNEQARIDLKDCLLYQRALKPVKPGRCTLLPDEERAPLALPASQRFRIYQEINYLRLLQEGLQETPLTLAQRDALAQALEFKSKVSFEQIRKLLRLPGSTQFNLEDPKRKELKGNATSALLSRKELFGSDWHEFDPARQQAIVLQLLNEENETRLIEWLQQQTGVDEACAERIANASLPEGYGSLSLRALEVILPALQREVTTYDKAVLASGLGHHSQLDHAASGEILEQLPYYGEYLQRHVGFGTGDPQDPVEKRFGRIANPTVHIGLNQIRTVVNALIRRYGHPAEMIVEVARDLKQSREQRQEEQERQASNQKRNERMRAEIAVLLEKTPERVKVADLHKMILWEELGPSAADRRCPYSGTQISLGMLYSDQVEIEHILPFSMTLDDSLNNKTVAMRQANRIKGNRTPWEARDLFEAMGWTTAGMLERAEQMPRNKRYRFGEEGYARWLRDDKTFLARALNDTRHLSRVAREYLSLVCPRGTRVIPGQMTAMLRARFGLNDILGLHGEKNRNDHRHHAVDACVIGVTDQGLLQRFAEASARARQHQLDRLIDDMPLPWPGYRDHVHRAVEHIWISHKPDHGYEGAMHNDTAYGLLGQGQVSVRKTIDGRRERNVMALKVIEIADQQMLERHGLLPDGRPRPYKGYKGDSNYCMDIVRDEKGKWVGEVVSTFDAYQLVRQHGPERLQDRHTSLSGKPLVMRLIANDMLKLELEGRPALMRIVSINSAGRLILAEHHEANVDARNSDRAGDWRYTYKRAGSLQKAKGRKVSISPIGELKDPGFPD